MLRNKQTISGNQNGKKPYESPRLIARGDILELTRGGGPIPVGDGMGTGSESGASM